MQRKQTEPYISTYLHSKGKRLGLPIGGNFELTARCNFNCPMCYVHLSKEQIEKSGKELTGKQWIDLALQAKNQGMVFALLTGGEPFVHPDFFEIYDAMKAMGLMISINSNGSLLKGDILDHLIENPPFRMNISLYGGTDETYRKMCGLPAFKTVVENIRALKNAGVDVRINLSITPYNKQDIAEIHRVSEELGVHVKASSYMYPSIRVNGEKYGCGNRLSPKEAAFYGVKWDTLRFSEEEFNQRAVNMKNMICVDESECPVEMDEGVGCRAGSSSFWMTWDGRMLPCGMMSAPVAYPLETGFEEAWNQIKESTKAIRMPSKCTTCPKRPMCPVCAAVCVTETGAFDQVPEYVCEQTQETLDQTWQVYCERNGVKE